MKTSYINFKGTAVRGGWGGGDYEWENEEKLAVTHTEQNTAKMAALVFALAATRASGAARHTTRQNTQDNTYTHTHTVTALHTYSQQYGLVEQEPEKEESRKPKESSERELHLIKLKHFHCQAKNN